MKELGEGGKIFDGRLEEENTLASIRNIRVYL